MKVRPSLIIYFGIASAGMLATISACTSKPTSVRKEPAMVTCSDDSPAARAAAITRQAVPQGAIELKDTAAIRNTLDSLFFSVFDTDHDGSLSLEEYAQRIWAQFLVSIPSGECRLNQEQWLMHFFGPPSRPGYDAAGTSTSFKLIERMFEALDRDRDGYVTYDDITNGLIKADFDKADRNGDGFVSPQEFWPEGHRPKSWANH